MDKARIIDEFLQDHGVFSIGRAAVHQLVELLEGKPVLKELLEGRIRDWEAVGNAALMERFVVRNGRECVAAPLTGKRGAPGECFKNATEYSQRFGGVYVEGFGLRPNTGIPIHHAWVLKDEKVIDVTWKRPEDCQYFGVPFESEIVSREIVKNGFYGLLSGPMLINVDLFFERDAEIRAVFDRFASNARSFAL